MKKLLIRRNSYKTNDEEELKLKKQMTLLNMFIVNNSENLSKNTVQLIQIFKNYSYFQLHKITFYNFRVNNLVICFL